MRMYRDEIVRITSPSLPILSSFRPARRDASPYMTFSNALWVDGLVIGSELFVKTTMARARGIAAVKKRKLTRAINASSAKVDIYCFKQLRVLLE